ncbi:DNA cytosine methyltransferase [Pseudomonas sp. NPDC087697]|uniref:DNA cytosine methyltransferase n=1 Tax=Pseudomonas sp. NPDC087697 TaxID=3364447 RepID=UPI0038191F68
MFTAIDLFSGFGGWTRGGVEAGLKVLWAANHWPEAVKWHTANNPDTKHVCQDLHQANWCEVPKTDVGLASPCCHGHTPARGKENGNPQHDSSRSTAWAVVSAAEALRQDAWVVENVPGFMNWTLYPAWTDAMRRLGYQLAPHIVDCADLGVPQHRVRLFMVCTRSKAPLHLQLQQQQHVPARSIIDFEAGKWSLIEKAGRAEATLSRVKNGRKAFGERFVMPYYGRGSGMTGRSLDRPIGTITTLDRWAIVDGDRMRMITANEAMAAQSFPGDTLRPDNHRLTMHMTGNAVPPLAGQRIIEALKAAA